MKKKFLKAMAAVLTVVCCVGALGCGAQNGDVDGAKVYLQALPDANAAATGTVQADYYLLA